MLVLDGRHAHAVVVLVHVVVVETTLMRLLSDAPLLRLASHVSLQLLLFLLHHLALPRLGILTGDRQHSYLIIKQLVKTRYITSVLKKLVSFYHTEEPTCGKTNAYAAIASTKLMYV